MESSDVPTQVAYNSPGSSRLKPLHIAGIVLLLAVLIFAGVRLTHTEAANLDSAATAPAAEVLISQNGLSPASLSLKPGQSVTWNNEDTLPHMLTITTGGFTTTNIASERLNQGDSFSYVFAEAGTYRYYDATSPQRFEGTITVK